MMEDYKSPSVRRVWIEITLWMNVPRPFNVALHMKGAD